MKDLVRQFVIESNKIENIRGAREVEVQATLYFINLDYPTVSDITQLAAIYAGEKGKLRDKPGMDVRVGNHYPPGGGPHIYERLHELVQQLHTMDEVKFHKAFETLHPFLDGNGRTGRALWAWQKVLRYGERGLALAFLQAWYYATLDESRR